MGTLSVGSGRTAQNTESLQMRDPKDELRTGAEYSQKVGDAMVELGRACEGYRALAVQVIGLTIRGPQFRGGEYLVVIRGLDEEGAPVVAFHSALDIGEVVRGVESRLKNGTLKWRADEFAS